MTLITKKNICDLNGKEVIEYTMRNKNGMEIVVLNYGCTITKWTAKDRNDHYKNVVLGFESFEDYLERSPYFGAVIGPVAGRIENASFRLAGSLYQLQKNDGENNLHGGFNGFDKIIWEVLEGENQELIFQRMISDGGGGFPGNREVQVTYRLEENDTLDISYEGVTDQPTIINMTNHTYFNLSGNCKSDILEHVLQIKASHYLPLKENLIPIGKEVNVIGTAFDFQKGKKVRIGTESFESQTLIAGNGYDHPFILDTNFDEEIVLIEPNSGRKLSIETDQKVVVFYAGTQLTENLSINGGCSRKYLGLCLETQNYPNAINEPSFPSIIIKQNEKYIAKTRYKFTTI
ncbi:aldose epimerase family protein [Bacillus cereus group sp. IBL03679]|uniref:aldose epimerase family protein n=1 Tax=Bacillus cereus group sp. IBL03679 TaxID=3240095 RepID=UPI003D2F51CF